MTSPSPASRRWLALGVVCLGVLMVVLDVTIVNVALPSIRADLGFSETTLVWVVNVYLLTCGGFLLLGGRLGDFAVLASVAALYTETTGAGGAAEIAALNAGYRLAFGVGAVCALVAAGLGALLLPLQPTPPAATADSGAGRVDQAA